MTGLSKHKAKCLTAGTIELSPDFKEIIRVTHDSCDFKPRFNSLMWLFLILISEKENLKGIHLSSKCTLEEQVGQTVFFHDVDTLELTEWISDNIRIAVKEQKSDKKIADYFDEDEDEEEDFISPSDVS